MLFIESPILYLQKRLSKNLRINAKVLNGMNDKRLLKQDIQMLRTIEWKMPTKDNVNLIKSAILLNFFIIKISDIYLKI
jgi:hypothetical protein